MVSSSSRPEAGAASLVCEDSHARWDCIAALAENSYRSVSPAGRHLPGRCVAAKGCTIETIVTVGKPAGPSRRLARGAGDRCDVRPVKSPAFPQNPQIRTAVAFCLGTRSSNSDLRFDQPLGVT